MDSASVNRVEAYFRHEMTEEEISQFRQDLAEDDELKQLYEEYHLAMETIDVQVEEELRSQFKEWNVDKEQPEANEIKLFPKILKIAASIALIAALAYLIFYIQNQPQDTYNLALNAYELPESPGSDMGKGMEWWAAGLDAYRNQNFEKAVSNWTKIQDLTPEQEYFLAHSYFNLNQFSDAASIFKMLSEGDNPYNFTAEWFLALAYLAEGQNEAFNKQVEKITENPNHPYFKDAELLREKAQKVFSKSKN
jgi:tetratricopeptide (TPR) repeat protein